MHLQRLVDGYQSTCILVAATRLGVFEALAKKPEKIAALAEKLNANVDSLSRLVRVLRSYGLISLDDSVLHLTDEGETLASDQGGIADQLRLVADEYLPVWSRLDVAIAQGKPVFETIFGQTPWQHRRRNPAIGDAFNRMTEKPQRAAADTIIAAYDFSNFSRVADLGGGRGYLLSSLLLEHPEMSGVLFDLPHIVASARESLERLQIQDRCVLQGGSFFDQIPGGVDLYILQYVLHDWDDEDCRTILTKCRAAMRKDSRLLILEKTLSVGDASKELEWLVLRDIHMMLVHGGRERQLEQYDDLLQSASLQRTLHRRLGAHLPDIIEATPS